MSRNGAAIASSPSNSVVHGRRRTSPSASRVGPPWSATTPSSTTAPIAVRRNTTHAGEKSSRPYLMNRYEAPQRAARTLPASVPDDVVTMDKIVALCKRRGFIFPSSEIYGGVGSTYDYGHYGVLLKNNVKARWWHSMLSERDDVVALDAAIIMHPRTWEASGHLSGFTDPLVDCRTCGQRFREDKLEDVPCP